MVCEDLTTANIGRPEEWFLKWQNDHKSFDEQALEQIYESGTSDSGIFGLKLMASQLVKTNWLLAPVVQAKSDGRPFAALRALVQSPEWVWIRRRDSIAQAVSHFLAKKSGVYHVVKSEQGFRPGSFVSEANHSTKISDVEFDFKGIMAEWYSIQRDTLICSMFFEATAIKPIEIWYEDYTGSLVEHLASQFGVTVNTEGKERNLTRMPQGRSQDMRHKFVEELFARA